MRNSRAITLFLGFVFILTSCQKSYTPEMIGTTPGTGGGTGTTGMLLVKSESKSTSNTEATTQTLQYDASNKVRLITRVDIDSNNNSSNFVYRYMRDGAGNVTRIITNALLGSVSPGTGSGSGLPDSLLVTIHYPAGSSRFDYSTYTLDLGGISFQDSTVYQYTNGLISDIFEYQAISGMTYTLIAKNQYKYNNNNLVEEKIYTPSSIGGMLTLSGTYTLNYTNKPGALYVGNEGFLLGYDRSSVSQNTISQATFYDNINNATILTVNYSMQFNSNNLPVSGTATQMPGGKTSNLLLTYQ